MVGGTEHCDPSLSLMKYDKHVCGYSSTSNGLCGNWTGLVALVPPTFVGPVGVDCLDRGRVLTLEALPSPPTLERYVMGHVVGYVVPGGRGRGMYVRCSGRGRVGGWRN